MSLCPTDGYPPGPSIVAVGPATALWRLSWPFDELARQGFPAAHLWASNTAIALGQDYRVVIADWWDAVWSSHEACTGLVQALHDDGKLVVLDLDDDILSIECWPDLEAQNHCRRVRPDLIEVTRQMWDAWRIANIDAIQLVDGVTVSTPLLADVVRSYTDRPVVVVPNVMDVRWWQKQVASARRRICSPVIGWAGSCRSPDLSSPIASAWAALARRYPDVTFVTIGCTPAAFTEEAALTARLFSMGYVNSAEWPAALAQIDIACVAATDTQWDRCKAPIKAWEFGLSGTALVATRTLYGPEIDDGVDGLLVDGETDWLAALERLLQDEALRRRLIRARRRRVEREHHIERDCWRWVDAWQTIIEQADPVCA